MSQTFYKTEEEKIKFRKILEAMSKLNHKELLAYWIDQELKGAEMYYRLHELGKEINWDDEISKLFFQLYKDSLEHAETLLKMFSYMFPNENPPTVDIPALDGEYSEERLQKMVYREALKDILEYLMGTEYLARDVYRYLAEKTEDENAKATLIWLANIENGHYQKLRNIYTLLLGGESGE